MSPTPTPRRRFQRGTPTPTPQREIPQPGDEGYVPEEALIDFCQDIHPRLVNTLFIWTGDREVAREVAEETLVRTWVAWPSTHDLESRTAWCFRQAHDLARARKRWRFGLRRPAPSGPQPAPGDGEAATIDAAALQGALSALSPAERDVLALRFIGGVSITDTAAVLRLTPGAVRQTSESGLDALRRLLVTPRQEVHLAATKHLQREGAPRV